MFFDELSERPTLPDYRSITHLVNAVFKATTLPSVTLLIAR